MATFKVLETQFQMFIKSRIYLDDEYIDKRALHKREYDIRVNERQMQTTEEKVDTSKALDANIRPIYDEEPMLEIQTAAEINVFATAQQHTEQPEFNNEGEVDQNAKQYHDTRPLPAKLTDNQTTELSYQSLESENICLKKTVAQFQKDFSRMEARCVNLELKYQNQALKEGQHGVIHKTNVSRPQLRSTQMKDKVVPNNSQVKDKKTEVEDHPRISRISRISNKTKSVTASNDSLKSKTLNVTDVCANCGKYVFTSNHDACVSKFLNDVNARTKKPKLVPISTRKPKSQGNKFIAKPHKKTVASESTIQKSKSYYRMLYEKTSKAWKWWIEQQFLSRYK
ncbi:hypothetical protein Tco_1326617 [Tanacetum coccineum]